MITRFEIIDCDAYSEVLDRSQLCAMAVSGIAHDDGSVISSHKRGWIKPVSSRMVRRSRRTLHG